MTKHIVPKDGSDPVRSARSNQDQAGPRRRWSSSTNRHSIGELTNRQTAAQRQRPLANGVNASSWSKNWPNSLGAVQRVLAFDQPLSAPDIQSVNELKQGSVWELSNVGARLILKAESYNAGEGAATFGARQEATSEIAAQELDAPGVNPLTPADQLIVSGLGQGLAGGGVPSMQGVLANVPNVLFFKVEHAAVGHSLGDVFTPRAGAAQIAQSPYTGRLRQPATHRGLGHMAAIDLIVGNGDRFTINHGNPWPVLDNLDFTADGPAAIDNVDPNSELMRANAWDAQGYMMTVDQRQQYAREVVLKLFDRTGINMDGDLPLLGRLIKEFARGMEDAVRSLRKRAGVFRLAGAVNTNPAARDVRATLADRMDLLEQ